MTSIYEVAKQAGVSITTVSHVFSGRRPVAEKTRVRVLEVANRLNYRPNHSAKSLATGRSMILGIHFPYEAGSLVRNPYFPEVLEGLSLAAAKTGYGFLLIPESGDADLLGRVDGAIIVDPLVGDPVTETILLQDMPVVTTGRCLMRPDIPWVDNDHQAGIRQIFSHLDTQGYRQPALLSTALRYSYIEDIERAYQQAVKARSASVRMAKPENLSEPAAYQAALEMLREHKRPDAIIASTDHQAVSVLRVARDLDIHVPEELGVVGEGDTILAGTAVPPLTSTRVQPRLLGEAAVELILALLDGNAENVENRLIPAKLIPRDSTLRVSSAHHERS